MTTRFNIDHVTAYSYSESVFIEPHYFRFKPKLTAHVVLASFDIKIDPNPVGLSEHMDAEHNNVMHCWFEGLHNQLNVSVNSVVEIKPYNPFNFLIHPPEYLQIPFRYDPTTEQLLRPSLAVKPISDKMSLFVEDILNRTKRKTIDFLMGLTQEIHQLFTLEYREVGAPHAPHDTFNYRSGSCRDLAWMLIHLLRHLGIATRYVSGYFYLDVENPQFELHAWVEVFLPGAGWIGLDPGHGIVVGTGHIPLASSAYVENTMPVTGSVRGSATSSLKHTLHISLLS